MNSIIDTINSLPTPKHGFGKIDQLVIEDAQATLNIQFSAEYKDFVKYIGALVFSGNEIFGTVPYPSLDVVSATLHARECDKSFPQSMYVVSDLHIDGILILQNSKGEIYQYTPFKFCKKIFDSLSDFIMSI